MTLSCIIPAYNRHELTARHVEECLKSTRLPDEIIVVNDGGPEYLRDLIVAYRGTAPIIYARAEEDIPWAYNMACNLGFWLSTGDVIAIEDTDHIPYRDAYANGLRALEENPDCDRVAFSRRIIDINKMAGPMEEWESTGNMGPNQMVAFLRRDVYLRLKGQDERMCGYYGYMAYDFPNRRDNILKAKSIKANGYWAVFGDEGEPGLKRGLSPHNRQIYKENARAGKLHSAAGILNCHFTFERL